MQAVTDRALLGTDVNADVVKRCRERGKRALASLKKNNPKAAAALLDPAPYIGVLCPRRAGKTFMAVLAALCTGESAPGSITIIMSLNLKQLKRLYWEGPSGINTLARRHGIKLDTNTVDLSWTHENGSKGYLLGCDDDNQLETIRGLEADLYLVDECKSFAPARLRKLIDDIITPQRASRKGRLMLVGTPGHILAGPFYEATCVTATRTAEHNGSRVKQPQCLEFGTKDPWGRTPAKDRLWSLHHWSLEDNRAMAHQWEEALITKRSMGWADDHPTWQREYLGRWSSSSEGLVYRYGAEKSSGRVTWRPEVTPENPVGLPPEGAPWRFIAGLDIGYEAPTALVVCGYSQKLGELRHVWDFSGRHLLVHQLAEVIEDAQARFGTIERIYADKGNLGKMIVQTLVRDYGFPIESADKREKYDHIELLNAAFSRGEVKIIENTTLEYQLLTNAWELDGGSREELGRLGRLREDKNVPNDSTDALIYLYRGSLHHFKTATAPVGPQEGSREWWKAREKEELRKARTAAKTDGQSRTLDRALTRTGWRSTLRRLGL